MTNKQHGEDVYASKATSEASWFPELAAELGPGLRLVEGQREEHRTPFGAVQAITYARFVVG
jgi:hypothetical protein